MRRSWTASGSSCVPNRPAQLVGLIQAVSLRERSRQALGLGRA